MGKIKSKQDNPKGLHAKYYIQKIKGLIPKGKGTPSELILKDVDHGSEYFVMRLDFGGKDKKHIEACRSAILHYAEQIKDHIPELSKDLIDRYS